MIYFPVSHYLEIYRIRLEIAERRIAVVDPGALEAIRALVNALQAAPQDAGVRLDIQDGRAEFRNAKTGDLIGQLVDGGIRAPSRWSIAEPPLGGVARERLEWRVPWKWHRGKTLRELWQIYGPGPMARVVGASLVLILGIRYLAERPYGPLEFDWVWVSSMSMLAGLMMCVIAAIPDFVPPRIKVMETGISVHRLQGGATLHFRVLQSAAVQQTDPPLLVLTYATRRGMQRLEYAIAPTVDVGTLARLLEYCRGSHAKLSGMASG